MKERIKTVRKYYHLTQVEFGEKIGVKGNTITGYENGTREPSDNVIRSICIIFDINEDWLRTGNGEMKVKISKNQEIARFTNEIMKDDDNVFKKRFLVALSDLSQDQWDLLEKIVEKIEKGEA